MRRFILVLGLVVAVPVLAQTHGAPDAGTAPVIGAVDFDGLVRIDKETALKHVTSKPGEPLDRERVSRDIRALYGMGAFDDCQAVLKRTADGAVKLVFRLKERPAVDAILIEGNDEVSEEDIRKKIIVRTASILDLKKVESSAAAIREHYVEQGYFLAEVDFRLNPKPDNLVDVVFVIREHAKVKVQRIEFVGNEKVPAEEIKAIMATQEGNLLSFLTGKGMFSREMFEDDIRRIEFFYNTKGYVEVKVDDPVVMLSRDRRFITISITVHEGEQYTVGNVSIEAPPGEELLFPEEELRKKLTLKPGQIFNALNVQKDDQTLGDMYKDLGYAFATVSNPHVLHKEKRLIDFVYMLQKGEKARFGRIDIIGNDGTRDWTIRRELRIYEGDWYSETKLRESEARVRRLGYFERVEVRPKPGRNANEVDVTVEVKERQTGAFTVGAGISSIENFMFQAQVSKQNFLGRGQNLSLQATLSSLRSIFMLSFEEPYFLDTDFTLALDLYNYEILFFNFTRATKGVDLTFGRRLSTELKLPSPWEIGLSATYKVEGVDVSTGGQKGVHDIPVAYLSQSGITSSLMGTVWFDSRDDRMFPTKGNVSSASLEWAGSAIGSDFQYMRVKLKSRQYFPLILGAVLKLQGEFGWIGNPGGSRSVPLFERFFVGGIFTVRGFERYSLGPGISTGSARDPAAYLNPFNIGGNKQLLFTSEIEFPIFTPIGIRGVVFFDAGNAFDDDENVNLARLRTSAGFGIRWWSPIGPLRFEWGFPLKPHQGEPPMVFEFNIGTF